MRKTTAPLQLKKRAIFLDALRQVGLVVEAARLTKIERHAPYRWAQQSDTFAEQFAEARQEGHEVLADRLERSLTERATKGAVEVVYYQGKKIGQQRRYSDTAAIVMLKSLRPGRFVEQLVGVNVAGQQVIVKIASFASLPSPPPISLPQPGAALGVGEEAGIRTGEQRSLDQ